jgi:hypothetical protein
MHDNLIIIFVLQGILHASETTFELVETSNEKNLIAIRKQKNLIVFFLFFSCLILFFNFIIYYFILFNFISDLIFIFLLLFVFFFNFG